MDLAKIESVIRDAVQEFNRQQPPDQQLGLSDDEVLLGEGGVLDSLGVINLIVAVEQNLKASADIHVDLLGAAVGESGPEKLPDLGALAQEIRGQLGAVS